MPTNPYSARVERLVRKLKLDPARGAASDIPVDEVLDEFEKRGAIHVREVLAGWFEAVEEVGFAGQPGVFGDFEAFSAQQALEEWDGINGLVSLYPGLTATPLHDRHARGFATCFVPIGGFEGNGYMVHCGDGPERGTVWDHSDDDTDYAVYESVEDMLAELEAAIDGDTRFQRWKFDAAVLADSSSEYELSDAWSMARPDDEPRPLFPGPYSWSENLRTSEIVEQLDKSRLRFRAANSGEPSTVGPPSKLRGTPDPYKADGYQIDCVLEYMGRAGAPNAKWLLREYFFALASNVLVDNDTLFGGMPSPNPVLIYADRHVDVGCSPHLVPISWGDLGIIAVDCSDGDDSGKVFLLEERTFDVVVAWDSVNAMLDNLRAAIDGESTFLGMRVAAPGDIASWIPATTT